MDGQKPKRLTEYKQYCRSFKLYSQSNLKFIFDVCNFDFNAWKKNLYVSRSCYFIIQKRLNVI